MWQGLPPLSLLRGHLCLWLRARCNTELAEHREHLCQQQPLLIDSQGMQVVECQGMLCSQPRVLAHVRVLGMSNTGMGGMR